MGEGYGALQRGGGLPVEGGGGSLMTHCVVSVTTQRIAFKCVMVSEPYNKIFGQGIKKLDFTPK
jgi:hypothetical protein